MCIFALLLLGALPGAHAVSRAIATDANAFPFIVDAETQKRINWSRGRVAEALASAAGVHVSARGVRFVHSSFTLQLDENATQRCARSDHALCVNLQPWRHVFPTRAAAVVLRGAGNRCLEPYTGRQLVLAGYNDVSLCDVLSGQQSVLLSLDGRLQSKHSNLSEGLQATLSLLAIFVIGCMVHRFTRGKSKVVGSLACSLACVLILVLVMATHDPAMLYVTQEDLLFFFALVAYMLFNVGRWAVRSWRDPYRPAPYSLFFGALNLLSFCLFTTVDNVCSPLIMAFLVGRMLEKLQSQEYRDKALHFIDIYLDAMVVTMLCKYGFYTQYDSTTQATLHLALLTTVLFVLGVLLANERREKGIVQ